MLNTTFRTSVFTVALLGLTACQSTSLPFAKKSDIATNAHASHVGHVNWQNSGNSPLLKQADIADKQANLVFIRPASELGEQSSVNIALNGEYLVSLQGNHYTQTQVCAGMASLSGQITGKKSNDLNAQAQTLNLQAKQNHYFLVNVNTDNQTAITAITPAQAQGYIVNTSYQAHQISRVQANCQ